MLTDIDANALASALAGLADIQLRLDPAGTCIEAHVTNPELTDLRHLTWVGTAWNELPSTEHQERASEALLSARKDPGTTVKVDLALRFADMQEPTPMTFRLVGIGSAGEVLAVGQDQRGQSHLRQQLVNAQQALERDYWAMRQTENRYRRMFEVVSDGLIVVDEASGRVLEANPRAGQLLTASGTGIVGKVFITVLETSNPSALEAMINEARRTGNARLTDFSDLPAGNKIDIDVTYNRQGSDGRFLIRATSADRPLPLADEFSSALLDDAPDAIVQLDTDGRLLAANRMFLNWVQVDAEAEVRGRTIDTWLGRSAVDAGVLLKNLRDGRSIRSFASVLRNQFGTTLDLEISAVQLTRGDNERYILFIRDISRRVTSDHPLTEQLPRSIEQVTQRVGRLPLKELVRESTDIIEALCIEAALKLTRGNRASAAEMLGLSRQSLYTKLRRYGIGEDEAER